MIDVLIAVDGAKLAQQVADGSLSPGTKGSPTNLGAWSSSDVYISMVSQHSSATNNQGQSELTITVNAGDSVRWTMTTFGSNDDYTAYLYNGNFNPTTAISPLVYLPITNSTYLPNANGTLTEYHNQVYAAQGSVLKPGVKIQYTLSFALINNATGHTIGYFYWDPFIQVNS